MTTSIQSTSDNSTSTSTGVGGDVQKYLWNWQGQPLTVIYETLGSGSQVLLLPAFSTVSTRSEMHGIAARLSSQYQVVTLDWPGFGQSERPPLDYQFALYHQFLQDFVRDNLDSPTAIVAAGHAAGYAMQLAQLPSVCSKVILVAPTWRGPLTVMGMNQQLKGLVRQLVRSPLLGQAVYKLNTTPSFLRLMYKRHVFTDTAKLTPEFISKKWQSTQQPGARYAPAAFVTGNIDPVQERAEFQAYFQALSVPVLLLMGKQVPPNSKAEMDAIAELPGVQSFMLPGSLGMHEEYADTVVEAILRFL